MTQPTYVEPGMGWSAISTLVHDWDGNRIEIIQWLWPYSSEENAPAAAALS